MIRALDWFKQAEGDLNHAKSSSKLKHFDWACFAAQQAAEKAVRALHQKFGRDAWGHSVADLLEELRQDLNVGDELIDLGKELDKHYIPARYPNAHPSNAPTTLYVLSEAERAVANAEKIIEFVREQIF